MRGSPFSRAWSAFAGPRVSSAGACHAPHTNAIRSKPSRRARTDALAHRRLALGLARVVLVGVGAAHGLHRLAHGLEQAERVAALLDHPIPPALAVVHPGRLGEQGQRVGGTPSAPPGRAFDAELRGLGEVDEPGRDAALVAWRSACHSGENEANGKNAACRTSAWA